MTTLRQKLEQWAEREAVKYSDPVGDASNRDIGDIFNAHVEGASQLIPMVVKLAESMEYIIEHERYHGVNQGKPSEQVAGEALADLEKFLEGK